MNQIRNTVIELSDELASDNRSIYHQDEVKMARTIKRQLFSDGVMKELRDAALISNLGKSNQNRLARAIQAYDAMLAEIED